MLSEVIKKVTAGMSPPYRPEVGRDACSKRWHDLMDECWEEDPEKRPSFDRIKNLLKIINGGR